MGFCFNTILRWLYRDDDQRESRRRSITRANSIIKADSIEKSVKTLQEQIAELETQNASISKQYEDDKQALLATSARLKTLQEKELAKPGAAAAAANGTAPTNPQIIA
mgnify:CR=1 FL=1